MRVKLEIVNSTHWSTRDLRRFMIRCARKEGVTHAKVYVRYNRQVHGSCSGVAYRNSYVARICLPTQSIDRVDMAHVIAHEFGHLRGVTHRQMSDDPHYRRVGRWRSIYEWAEQLPLAKQAMKATPRATGSDKLAHAKSKLAEWTSKAKRVNTKLLKWKRKVAYYERKQQTVRNTVLQLRSTSEKSFYLDART